MAEIGAGSVAGLTVLTAFEVPNMYSGLLPSLFTISTFSGGDSAKQAHTVKWIRRGEIQATVMSLAVGLGASVIAHSPWPLFAVIAMCGYLLYQYEGALHRGNAGEGPGLDMRHGAS
jgi:hypothetical protein